MSENTKKMPVWLLLLIVFLVFAVVGGGIAFAVYKLTQKPEQTASTGSKNQSVNLNVGEMKLLEPSFQNAYTIEISDNTIISVDEKSKIAKGLSGGQASVTLTDTVTGEVMVYLFSVTGDTTAAEEGFKIVPSTEAVQPLADNGNQRIPTGMTLSYSDLTLSVGESKQQPSVTITPGDAENKDVTWGCSDSSIAMHDTSGKITGVSAGDCIITVTALGNTDIKSEIHVHVNAADNKSSQNSNPYAANYSGQGIVYAPSGKAQMVSTSGKVVATVPQGTVINLYGVPESDYTWYTVYNGTGGYLDFNDVYELNQIQYDYRYGYITTTTGESVNLREYPSTSSTSKAKIPYASYIGVGTSLGEWTAISYNGNKGFVMTKFITDTQPNSNSGGQQSSGAFAAYINTSTGQSVNLRSTASTSGKVLIQIPNGTKVTVESSQYYNNEWLKVTYKGKTGYIRQDLLSY